jgi:uncharacterized repeat protein (TIGR03803 family)
MLEGSDGMLYSTTFGNYGVGGDSGGVFKINKDGTGFSVIHKFSSPSEGDTPWGALVEATNGALYGMNYLDGSTGAGSSFKLNKNGSNFMTIHQCAYATNNIASPESGLLFASDGFLYGAGQYGGASNAGAIFRMDLNGGNFTIIRSLNSGVGDYPGASVIEGTNGALYGVGYSGGLSNVGTIFKLDKNGSNFSVIHHFLGRFGRDGADPLANLAEGPNGKLYGTASSGGSNGFGVVFSIDHNGSNYTVLHHFGSVVNDGVTPFCAMTTGPGGLLYGTTYSGGTSASGNGTVFQMAPDGSSYEVLLRFTGTNGPYFGAAPEAGLIAGSDGALYGTCNAGGVFNRGTVFKLAPDQNRLAPPQRLAANVWLISGHGAPLRSYTLQYSTNLNSSLNWSNLTTVTADAQGNWQYNEPTNSAKRFFRTTFP